MPKIPTPRELGLGRIKSNVGGTPSQNLTTTPAMFGATQAGNLKQAGEGLMQASEAWNAFEEKRGKDQDLKHKLDIENQIREFQKVQFEGTPNKPGINAKRLGDAAGSANKLKEDWKIEVEKLTKDRTFYSASNKELVDAYIKQKGMEMDTLAFNHEEKQRDEELKGLLQNRITSSIDEAALVYHDKDALDKLRVKIQTSNNKLGERFKLSKEEIKKATLDDVSEMNAKAIEAALIAENPLYAMALHEAAILDGTMSGKHNTAIMQKLFTATLKKVGQELADKAFTLYPDNPTKAMQNIMDNAEGEKETAGLVAYTKRWAAYRATPEFEHIKIKRIQEEQDRELKEEKRLNLPKAQKRADELFTANPDDPKKSFEEIFETTEGDLQEQLVRETTERYGASVATEDLKDRARKRAESIRKEKLEKERLANLPKAQTLAREMMRDFPGDPTGALDHISKTYEKDLQEQLEREYVQLFNASNATEDQKEKLAARVQAGKTRRAAEAGQVVFDELRVEPDELKAIKKLLTRNLPAEVEQEAMRLLNNYHSAKTRDEVKKKIELKEESWKVIVGGGTTAQLSPEQINSLSGPVLSAMMRFEKQRSETGRGFAMASDPHTDNALHQLYMSDKLAFAEYDITQHIDAFTETDYNYWKSQQRSIDKGLEKDTRKNVSYTLADRLAKESLNSAGIKYGTSAGTKDASKSQKVFRLVRSIVDEAYDANKPELANRDVISKKLSELFLTGEMDDSHWWNDDKGYKFEMLGKDKGTWMITDVEGQKDEIAKAAGVPNSEILDIADALKDADMPITLENIKNLYDRRKQK